ncbi:MAG: hypothetical protein ABJO67_21055 [Pseudoruegeria sp.]
MVNEATDLGLGVLYSGNPFGAQGSAYGAPPAAYDGPSTETARLREERYGLSAGSRSTGELTGPGTPLNPFFPPSTSLRPVARPEHFFLADTPIQMWPLDPVIKPRLNGSYDEKLVLSKVWYKRQDQMQTEDFVASNNKQGRLQPDRVTRTMTKTSMRIWISGIRASPRPRTV